MRICGLVLFMAAAPLLAQPAAPKSGVEMVPATGFGFVSVRVSDLQKLEVFKPLRDALADLEKTEPEFARFFGIPIEDMDRVTLYWPMAPMGNSNLFPYIAVTTRAPFNEARLIRTLKARPILELDHHHGHDFEPRLEAIPQKAGKATGPGAAKSPAEIPPPKSESRDPKFQNLLPDAQAGAGQPAGKEAGREPAPADWGEENDMFFRDDRAYPVLFLLDQRTILYMPRGEDGPVGMMAYIGQLLRRKGEGPLSEALAAAEKHSLVAAVRVAPLVELVRHEEELARELAPYRALFKARTAMLTMDLAARSTLQVRFTFEDEASARRAEPVAKTMIQNFSESLQEFRKKKDRAAERDAVLNPLVDLLIGAMDRAEVRLDGRVVATRMEMEMGETVRKAVAGIPDLLEMARSQSRTLNNLKQIGLAIHNYHDTMGQMPGNITGPDGKPLFSWRVAILPFIEQDNVFRALDLTKPWDDPRNAKVLQKMPDVFRVHGRDAGEGKTFLQMPFSPRVPAGGRPFLVPGQRTNFGNIADGTSNTIMVLEAADGVHWAKPEDVLYDPKNLMKTGAANRKWFYTLFGDGFVQVLDRSKITDDQFRAFLTIDGGEVNTVPR